MHSRNPGSPNCAAPQAIPKRAWQSVVMNFTARPEHQWQFILAAIAHASDDEFEDHPDRLVS